MNLRTALQVTLVLGWAGLVVELAGTHPWVLTLIVTATLLGGFLRTR